MNRFDIRLTALKLGIEFLKNTDDVNKLVGTSKIIENYLTQNLSIDAPKNDLNSFLNQCSILNPIKGILKYNQFDYQKDLYTKIQNNNHIIINQSRQIGVTVAMDLYLLWYALTNTNQQILIMSSSFTGAKNILENIKYSYDLFQGEIKLPIIEKKEDKIVFLNNSTITITASSVDALRGKTADLIFIDNAAYISHKVLYEFWSNNHQYILKNKCIISSSPNAKSGLFYDLYTGDNEFVKIELPYTVMPGRDKKWKQMMLKDMSEKDFERDYECKFI